MGRLKPSEGALGNACAKEQSWKGAEKEQKGEAQRGPRSTVGSIYQASFFSRSQVQSLLILFLLSHFALCMSLPQRTLSCSFPPGAVLSCQPACLLTCGTIGISCGSPLASLVSSTLCTFSLKASMSHRERVGNQLRNLTG